MHLCPCSAVPLLYPQTVSTQRQTGSHRRFPPAMSLQHTVSQSDPHSHSQSMFLLLSGMELGRSKNVNCCGSSRTRLGNTAPQIPRMPFQLSHGRDIRRVVVEWCVGPATISQRCCVCFFFLAYILIRSAPCGWFSPLYATYCISCACGFVSLGRIFLTASVSVHWQP